MHPSIRSSPFSNLLWKSRHHRKWHWPCSYCSRYLLLDLFTSVYLVTYHLLALACYLISKQDMERMILKWGRNTTSRFYARLDQMEGSPLTRGLDSMARMCSPMATLLYWISTLSLVFIPFFYFSLFLLAASSPASSFIIYFDYLRCPARTQRSIER